MNMSNQPFNLLNMGGTTNIVTPNIGHVETTQQMISNQPQQSQQPQQQQNTFKFKAYETPHIEIWMEGKQ
jgi:cysteine synthase